MGERGQIESEMDQDKDVTVDGKGKTKSRRGESTTVGKLDVIQSTKNKEEIRKMSQDQEMKSRKFAERAYKSPVKKGVVAQPPGGRLKPATSKSQLRKFNK